MRKNAKNHHAPRNDTSAKKRRHVHAIREQKRRANKTEQRIIRKEESKEKDGLELGFGL